MAGKRGDSGRPTVTSVLSQTELTPIRVYTATNSQATTMKPMILARLQSMPPLRAATAVQASIFPTMEGAPRSGRVALIGTDPPIFTRDSCHQGDGSAWCKETG